MLTLPNRFIPGFGAAPALSGPAYWFIFAGNSLLVERSPAATVPLSPNWPIHGERSLRQLYMGRWQDHNCIAAEVAADFVPPDGYTLSGLRALWGELDGELVGLAGQAVQLVDWDRCHQFCGRCGEPMTLRENERAKHCGACNLSHYPRVAPAVMVRILRGDEILLARSPRFAPGMYSVLAGFVDPGESLEQTAHREVMEEVGLKITNLKYLTSQPWPFPHSLMLAFSADYAGGEINLQDDEIEHAAWFRRGEMPGMPITMSIARFLIDDYLAKA